MLPANEPIDLNQKYVKANIPSKSKPVWLKVQSVEKLKASVIDPEQKTLSDICGVDLKHIQEMMDSLTVYDLDQIFTDISFLSNLSFDDRPYFDRYLNKVDNINNIVRWMFGNPRSPGVQVIIEKLEARVKEKSQLPVKGEVPGTHYIKWSDFTALPSYVLISRAVHFPHDYKRKCSPVTKDGYVAVDAIYNMSAWANWKSSSLGDEERKVANEIDALNLGDLMRLNSGRRMDQPALFPEKLLPCNNEYMAKTKHDPVKYAESVLTGNMFEEVDLPIYSGESGLNPLGVPDSVWNAVFNNLGGKFVRYGDLFVIAGGDPVAEPGLLPAVKKAPRFVRFLSGVQVGSIVSWDSWQKELKGMVQRGETPPKVEFIPDTEENSFVRIGEEIEFKLGNERFSGFVVGIDEPDNHEDQTAWLEVPAWEDKRESHPISKSEEGDVWKRSGRSIVHRDLAQSIREEIKAQKDYKERAENASSYGDKVTAEIYNHIGPEEKEHEQELTRRLKDIGGQMEFLADSPEFLTETIQQDGWQEKLDQAFEAAIAKVRGS